MPKNTGRKPKLRPSRNLTPAQVRDLGAKLKGTTGNVYRIAASMFNVEADDALWERLSQLAGIFKCEVCGYWLSADKKAGWTVGTCTDCTDEEEE